MYVYIVRNIIGQAVFIISNYTRGPSFFFFYSSTTRAKTNPNHLNAR